MEQRIKSINLLDDLGNDLLADVSISSIMDEINTKFMQDISEKRNKIIAQRLKEIVGIDLNLEDEAKRRFKRFATERIGDKETIYFNDGTDNGKRIVTFVSKQKPISFEADECKMSMEYEYY